MVVTPDYKPLAPSEPLSPLLLPHHHHPNPKPPIKQRSTGSFSHISDFQLEPAAIQAEEKDPVESLRHVDLSIDPAEWRQLIFKTKVLSLLRRLRIPRWTDPSLQPASIHLQKVSGALTNAVFFVSFNPSLTTPTTPSFSPLLTPKIPAVDAKDTSITGRMSQDQYPPTLLLRVYGPSSGALISRTEELRILTVLSLKYRMGPKVYGTFLNGRLEQFFPSRALHALEMRDPDVSGCIAKRMRELHAVDLKLLGFESTEPMVWRFLKDWSELAEDVLVKLEGVNEEWRGWVTKFGLHKVREEMEQYRRWVRDRNEQKAVFAHNDAQYGNILRLDDDLPLGIPEHHRYIVIDFEYAAPNARGYDIANHFHEWRADYHHPTHSHSLRPHFPYPTLEQRQAFYRAYLFGQSHRAQLRSRSDPSNGAAATVLGGGTNEEDAQVEGLEREVRMWSPASSAFWALWGIVQAEDYIDGMVEGKQGEFDFDYLSYAIERVEMFRTEAKELGAIG